MNQTFIFKIKDLAGVSRENPFISTTTRRPSISIPLVKIHLASSTNCYKYSFESNGFSWPQYMPIGKTECLKGRI